MSGMTDFYAVVEAMQDPRVVRALELAERDQRIRKLFGKRKLLAKACHVIEQLSEEFFLSEEHIRTIVYRKGRRRD